MKNTNKENSTVKKVMQIAGTSILATGLVAAPTVTGAQSLSSPSTSSSSYQTSSDQPTVYNGNSMLYFEQNFFGSSSSLTHGESGAAPIAKSLSFIIKKSTVFSSQLQATDEETNDNLTYHLLTQPQQGKVVLTNTSTGTFEYSGTVVGTYTFTYNVTDPQNNQSEVATVTIEVKKDKEDKDPSSSTPTTPAPTTPSTPTPVAAQPVTIDAVHSTKDTNGTATGSNSERTKGAATLSKSDDNSAVLDLIYDRVHAATEVAAPKETITIAANAITGKQQYQFNFAGNVVQSLVAKQNGLAIQTGDVRIYVPASAFTNVNRNLNLSNNTTANWTIKAEKVSPASFSNWAGNPVTTAGGTYQVSVQIDNDGTVNTLNNYNNRYVQLSVAAPENAASDDQYIALSTDSDGSTHVVPVLFDNQGQASIHSLENGTFTIVKVNPSNNVTNASPELKKLVDKQIIPVSNQATVANDGLLTRGQLASYLVNALGINVNSAPASTFTDIDPSSSEAKAIQALYHAGVLRGISATQFAPNRTISKEQLAVILTRAASAYGLDQSSNANNMANASNNSSSQWAKAELDQAISSGNNTGVESAKGSALTASPTTTQSEGATMLVKWLQDSGLLN
ncbi:S-layer homology domain-containing protein [Paenibacillus sp. KACC 21273]|uniref:S-layer homology domain-containing protein n=1 Tax=Paenibacillus sp. KACC 21273 TaxID=3025665 RepID=UPI0023672720|nr:S-layer homology domain-containing protein [Paenibacillus sp. KACC 21273]WDF49798.1 S-layer homology domain-containing protein [Paenibacillus sp. KACC 21273]